MSTYICILLAIVIEATDLVYGDLSTTFITVGVLLKQISGLNRGIHVLPLPLIISPISPLTHHRQDRSLPGGWNGSPRKNYPISYEYLEYFTKCPQPHTHTNKKSQGGCLDLDRLTYYTPNPTTTILPVNPPIAAHVSPIPYPGSQDPV